MYKYYAQHAVGDADKKIPNTLKKHYFRSTNLCEEAQRKKKKIKMQFVKQKMCNTKNVFRYPNEYLVCVCCVCVFKCAFIYGSVTQSGGGNCTENRESIMYEVLHALRFKHVEKWCKLEKLSNIVVFSSCVFFFSFSEKHFRLSCSLENTKYLRMVIVNDVKCTILVG